MSLGISARDFKFIICLYLWGNNVRIEKIKLVHKEEILMSEKVYKIMGAAGATSLAVGICVLTGGIAGGVLLIVHGARLLKSKSKLVF